MEESEIKILFVNESDAQSIVSDVFTFGLLFAGFWFAYAYLEGSVIFQILMFVMAFIIAIGRGSNKVKRMKPKEALEYLAKKYGAAE